jgi:SH3 domain-containing YSC84-like protein 1
LAVFILSPAAYSSGKVFAFVTTDFTYLPLKNEVNPMLRKALSSILGFLLLLLLVPVVHGASTSKDEETLRNADSVLQAMLSSDAVPADVLSKAKCIIVLPGVKKFGFGVGGSGGRGPMLCRTGKNFSGPWSAPAMYSIGGVSAGLQVGGSSTDYVILVMTQKGVDPILKGHTKLGSQATATAGPSGATASSVSGNDVFTYARAKGLFAGASLGEATLDPDNDANQRLYGKDLTAKQILIENAAPAPASGQPLVSLLNGKTSTTAAQKER